MVHQPWPEASCTCAHVHAHVVKNANFTSLEQPTHSYRIHRSIRHAHTEQHNISHMFTHTVHSSDVSALASVRRVPRGWSRRRSSRRWRWWRRWHRRGLVRTPTLRHRATKHPGRVPRLRVEELRESVRRPRPPRGGPHVPSPTERHATRTAGGAARATRSAVATVLRQERRTARRGCNVAGMRGPARCRLDSVQL